MIFLHPVDFVFVLVTLDCSLACSMRPDGGECREMEGEKLTSLYIVPVI